MITAGPGDECTWGPVWHPDDPRSAEGLDCPHCGADLDVDDLCVNRCNPNLCTDLQANERLYGSLLLESLRLRRDPEPVSIGGIMVFPDRPAPVEARLKQIDVITNDLLDRIPCRNDRSVSEVIEPPPQDKVLDEQVARFELALDFGQILDDRDALVVLLEQLRQRGELVVMGALRRTLDRAGMLAGPDDGEDEHEADLSRRSTALLDELVREGRNEAVDTVRELMVRADVGAWVEPAPKSGTLTLIEGGRDAHG